jgi:hypothetical protein
MEPVSSLGFLLLAKTAVGGKVLLAAKAAFVSAKAYAATHATWFAAGKIATSATLAYAGSVARKDRHEAQMKLDEAKRLWGQAHSRAVAADNWVGSLVQGIELTRVTTATWGVIEVRKVTREQGLLELFEARFPELIGGGAALQSLTPPPSKRKSLKALTQIDDASVVAAYASLGILGVQFVDKIGLVSVPVLQSSVHDLVASIPIEGASQIAVPFSGTSIAVGDVLWGGFAGRSLWRLVANKKATRQMADDVDRILLDVKTFNAEALEAEERGRVLQTQLQALKDASYAVYEAIAVQRAFYETHPGLVRASRDVFASQLSDRVEAWQFQLLRGAATG